MTTESGSNNAFSRNSSPFRVTRIILPGDELRLAEADYLRDVLDASEAYKLGFEEGHYAIIGLG